LSFLLSGANAHFADGTLGSARPFSMGCGPNASYAFRVADKTGG
jgi:hypothetical protein